MSINDDNLASSHPLPPRNGSTAAADVSFAKLNPEHHPESSSQPQSRSSSTGKKSSSSSKLARWKGKHWSGHDTPTDGAKKSEEIPAPRSKKTGGFLLENIHILSNGRPRGPEKPQAHVKSSSPNGQIQPVDNRKCPHSRISGESSRLSSPLSHQISQDDSTEHSISGGMESKRPAVDPAQLVKLALNLSESRKRHVSSNLPLPVSPAQGRRVVSALDSGYGTVKSNSSSGKRASYLSGSLRQPSPNPRSLSSPAAERPEEAVPEDNVFYTFTPATLSRAEKARRYFELASEHRRLLEHLPPLKPDATAPGNFSAQSTSSPGTAHYEVTRIPSYTKNKRQLGRAYNPLQALRNRRLRNRERRPLTAPPETWQETDRIKRWIDGVETASRDLSYRPGEDQVRLPPFSGELEAEAARPETANKRHRRTDTASSVVTRPENGWTIEPAELLADTYWIEKGDNKTIIEDKQGNRVFPARPRASLEVPRQSKEIARVIEHDSRPQSLHDESEDDGRVRPKHRNILPIPHRLRRNRINRSASETSNSSDEGRKPPPLKFGSSDGDENIGPLERHMRSMIEKDEKGELSSPELVSPDHWDSKYTPFPNARSSMDQPHRGSINTANGRLSVDTTHKRSRSAEGRGSVDHGMASMDEVTTASPDSPSAPPLMPIIGEDLSNTTQDRDPEHKSKRHHLPVFRSRSKERNNIDHADFATNIGQPLSPVLSADSGQQTRSSLEIPRPAQFMRSKTAASTTSSLRRINTTDSSNKDSASSTGGRRFFKGGRIGELVRGEGRFRAGRDRPGDNDTSRAASEDSDAENEPKGGKRGRKETPTGTDSEVSPGASPDRERNKSKYYTSNLPSFVSPAARDRRSNTEIRGTGYSDPFSGNRTEPDSGRSGNPLPPRIQLPSDDTASDPEMIKERANNLLTANGRRKSASQNNLSIVPTSSTISQPKRRDGLPVTGLAKQDAKRHWSISDKTPVEQPHKVTNRDIARVRALLLASGIKAHDIYQKADSVRESPVPVIAKAAETAGKKLDDVPRKQENVVAARMLSDALDESTSGFEKDLRSFQTDTAKSLANEIEELSHRAGEQLTKIVLETSDEADAFNVELTTKQPQEVKRVEDAIEAMYRQRRKQFRIFRHAGFKLLEWLVLGIMWWVWFVVVLFKFGRNAVVGVLQVLKWLLWF